MHLPSQTSLSIIAPAPNVNSLATPGPTYIHDSIFPTARPVLGRICLSPTCQVLPDVRTLAGAVLQFLQAITHQSTIAGTDRTPRLIQDGIGIRYRSLRWNSFEVSGKLAAYEMLALLVLPHG